MQLDFSGKSGASLALDVAEVDHGTAAGTVSLLSRTGRLADANELQGPLFNSISGWAVTVNRNVAGMNEMWLTASSLAATRKQLNTTRFLIPVGANRAAAPAFGRQNRRFMLECIIKRTTPLVAAAPICFGMQCGGGTMSEINDTAIPAFEIVSRSDVNGGRWTVRSRQVAAGAVTSVDSGVDPATSVQTHLAIVYEDATIPRMYGLVNGALFNLLQGIGAVPVDLTGNSFVSGIVQGLSAGGGAAQVDFARAARYRIWDI